MQQTIIISNGTTSVELPRVKTVDVGGTEVTKAQTMASGKIVKDVIGHRTKISATWDYMKAETITTLLSVLKAGGFYDVSYPSPDGGGYGLFSITYPTLGIFAFKNGVPVWHNVTLSMEAQEVT